jgi:eukaryotic-like serine/threonine-protein kinase
MKAEPQRACPNCGNELSGAMEFCPVCMLRKGLAGGVESGESSFEETLKLTPEQTAQRFEHYELVTGDDGKPVELGRGAMGVTYKAFDTVLRHAVALKVIDARIAGRPDARERFLREARAAARLRHPNVASVFYYGMRKSDGQCFYAMELVEGETLEARMRRDGPLLTSVALEIVSQVARAMAAAEAQGLVHRDLKPANLMLAHGAEFTVKVIDFGLAKAAAAEDQTDLTQAGFVGTPAFASPEQFVGVGVDIRSDLYSLGVTLWEMLTGQTPFRGSPAEVMYQHQRALLPLEQVKGVPQPVVALLDVLLEKDPGRRFQNPAELLKAISAVMRAVEARRTIAHQKLRAAFVQKPSSRPKKLPSIRAPKRSIAVLPFANLSNDKRNAYFADGVQDEILFNLAKVSRLNVISRTSAMTYRPEDKRNLRSIAESLGVANVVEGTVRRDGNRVRITIRLVDARTDKALWSESYDRDLTDIFAIQSEVAQAVASKLSARLSPEEKKRIEAKPTDSLEAYDLYLQAKESITNSLLRDDYGENGRPFLDAIALLEQATRLDSTFALAYCHIAKADAWLYRLNLDDTPKRRMHGDAAVNEALRLKPNLPETHLAAALHLYMCSGDHQGARVHIAIAEQALPNSSEALALSGYLDRRQGHWAESTKALERACNLDPKHSEILLQLTYTYALLNQYRDLQRSLDRLVALDPKNPRWKVYMARISFDEKAELSEWRAALEALPSSIKNNEALFTPLMDFAIYSRDWTKARELVRSSSNEELPFGERGPLIPRICLEIPIAKYQGEHPEMNAEFAAARNQLLRKVEGHPADPKLLSALSLIDAHMGRKQDALQEAKRAVEMLPVSKDALDGPPLVVNLEIVYALTKQPDLAFPALDVSIRTPASSITYGALKLDPAWDLLRADPRFEKVLAQLAPTE